MSYRENTNRVGRVDLVYNSWLLRRENPFEAYEANEIREMLGLPSAKSSVHYLLRRYEQLGFIATDTSSNSRVYHSEQNVLPIPLHTPTEVGMDFALDVVTGFFLPKHLRPAYIQFHGVN